MEKASFCSYSVCILNPACKYPDRHTTRWTTAYPELRPSYYSDRSCSAPHACIIFHFTGHMKASNSLYLPSVMACVCVCVDDVYSPPPCNNTAQPREKNIMPTSLLTPFMPAAAAKQGKKKGCLFQIPAS